MNSYKKEKKRTAFSQFLIGYAVVWLIATAIVSVILWKGLDKYQSDYDAAKEAANPDLVMDVALFNLDRDNIKSIIDKEDITINSRFETKEDYKDFFYDFLEGKTLTYSVDEEKNSSSRPVYNVYADDILFAKVSLKQSGEKDGFGFNSWAIDDIVVSENNYEFHDVYLCISDDMTAYINGEPVGANEYVKSGAYEGDIADVAYNLTGVRYTYKSYYAGNLIKEPEILVLDKDGNDISDNYVVSDNDLRDYCVLCSDEFKASVFDDVVNFCETYTYHVYRQIPVDTVAALMVDGSDAEAILYNIQSTLAWAWVPQKVEIVSEDYDEFVYYNDEYFSFRCNFVVNKSDSEKTETEESSCRWLFKNVNGTWMATYFTYK